MKRTPALALCFVVLPCPATAQLSEPGALDTPTEAERTVARECLKDVDAGSVPERVAACDMRIYDQCAKSGQDDIACLVREYAVWNEVVVSRHEEVLRLLRNERKNRHRWAHSLWTTYRDLKCEPTPEEFNFTVWRHAYPGCLIRDTIFRAFQLEAQAKWLRDHPP